LLSGGIGKDTMSGGADADWFSYDFKSESVKGANRDVILDFSGVNGGELDQIDLFDIDAKKGAGNQAFKFIGAQKFHHKAGELQVKYNAATDIAIVSGDIDGNGKADFQIEVHSIAALAKADFIL
jgi:serralysin